MSRQVGAPLKRPKRYPPCICGDFSPKGLMDHPERDIYLVGDRRPFPGNSHPLDTNGTVNEPLRTAPSAPQTPLLLRSKRT